MTASNNTVAELKKIRQLYGWLQEDLVRTRRQFCHRQTREI